VQIDVYCGGRSKDQWCATLKTLYQQRCSPFFRVQWHDAVPLSKMVHLVSEANVVAFDAAGLCMSSEEFSNNLYKAFADGRGKLSLLIGGPEGLGSLRSKLPATKVWSLSALTFPHQLAQVLVAEQLYRAATLYSGHPYHKI